MMYTKYEEILKYVKEYELKLYGFSNIFLLSSLPFFDFTARNLLPRISGRLRAKIVRL